MVVTNEKPVFVAMQAERKRMLTYRIWERFLPAELISRADGLAMEVLWIMLYFGYIWDY